jgi:hypothetical protein
MFEHVERICSDDFIPNKQDAIHNRIKTTGVRQMQIQLKNTIFTYRSDRFHHLNGLMNDIGLLMSGDKKEKD